MYRYHHRTPRRAYVTFRHCFKDAAGQYVECEISGTIHPGQEYRRGRDPDDSQEGYPAEFEVDDVTGITRPVTDEEYDALSLDNEVEVRAFEEVEV